MKRHLTVLILLIPSCAFAQSVYMHEAQDDAAASFRFIPKDMDDSSIKCIYDKISNGDTIDYKFSSIINMDNNSVENKPIETSLFKPEDF